MTFATVTLFPAPESTPPATRADWAARIKGHWGAALESVLATGRDLIEAKASLDHGEFLPMIENDLPFGASTAERLIKIARNPRFANSAHAPNLPPSWMVLYELTKIKDDALFEAALADGRIRPDMERNDAALLRTSERRTTRLARNEALAAASVPLETVVAAGRRYPVVYADPPWEFKTYGPAGREKSPDQHYPVMSREAIAALPIGTLAAPDAALFLWTTVGHLALSLELMQGWGFAYKSHAVWRKTYAGGASHRGTGYWFINTHELLMLGTRGDVPAPLMGSQDESVITAPVGRHSEKPALFREMIERYFPGVGRVELFARVAPPGWDVWGNQAGGRVAG